VLNYRKVFYLFENVMTFPCLSLSSMTHCPVKEVHPRAGTGTERGKKKKTVTGIWTETETRIKKETEIGRRTRREIGTVIETRIENTITGIVTETVSVIATTEIGIEMIMTATGMENSFISFDFTINTLYMLIYVD
jgi:hypothetical protein